MNSKVNSNTSFGSTVIPYDKTLVRKYSKTINNYFSKTIAFPKNMSSQQIANKLNFDEVGVVLEKNGIRYVGKDGGIGGADTFLGKILKKINPNAKHVEDVKPVKFNDITIDMDI